MRRSFLAFVLSAAVTVVLAAGPPAAVGAASSCNWIDVPGVGGVTDLQDVAALAPDDVWAVGSGSQTTQPVTQHWDGSQWTLASGPSFPLGATLFALAAISPGDVWAVGSVNTGDVTVAGLAEHWDGSTWTVVPTAPSGAGNDFLRAASASGTDDVWAVGYTSTESEDLPLIEHWDGSTWSVAPSPRVSFVNGVAALSPSSVWVTADAATGFEARLAHWNGSSWHRYPSGVPFSDLRGIAARNNHDVWAVGLDFSLGTLVEHWDGTSWTRTPSENPKRSGVLYDVVTVSARAWAVGGTGRRPLIERWNGSSWNIVRPASKDGPLRAIARVPGTQVIWAVGQHIERYC
jgi:hypothetical protein